MEGVTNHYYRTLHARFFPGSVDAYFSPFLSPTNSPRLSTKEMRDVLPENNEGVNLIPQILTNDSQGFLQTAEKLARLGYETVNLNLGCPSGTVVSKGRGAGFLADPAALDRFLDEIFSACPMPISVKTRIGMDSVEEFSDLLEIYNRYPITELTVHPRIRQEFYKGKPHLDCFAQAVEDSKIPLCYNGDIFCKKDYEAITQAFPSVQSVMLGRGLIGNPALARELSGGKRLEKEELRSFTEELVEIYRVQFSGDRNAICHMKELWFYMAPLFTNHEKYAKKINKAQRMSDYQAAVASLFREQELIPGGGYHK